MSVVIDMRWYILRRKLLHKMEVCGAISHKMDELIVRKQTQLLIYFLHTCIYFAILSLEKDSIVIEHCKFMIMI